MNPEPSLLQPVADYYAERLARHGACARGADWRDADGQERRFTQLLRVADGPWGGAALDDYGCGYGALFDRLGRDGAGADYLGLDISEAMIAEARRRHPADTGRFVGGSRSPRQADYAVASGIFNVRLEAAEAGWEAHIRDTLDLMHEGSRRGFAFNCLSGHSDPPFMKGHLYYGDPAFYLDLCLRRYSRQAVLLHDYGLFEFTVLVRKPSP